MSYDRRLFCPAFFRSIRSGAVDVIHFEFNGMNVISRAVFMTSKFQFFDNIQLATEFTH